MPAAPHLAVAALCWSVFVVYGSLVPLKYQSVPLDQAIAHFRNLPPLWFGLGTRADWVANILLFIPLTFLWMGVLTCDRGPIAKLVSALAIVPAGAAAAVALEFTQIWFAGRTVSKNDIVAETIGSVIGVGAWLGIGAQAVGWFRAFVADQPVRPRYRLLLDAYIIGLTIYSVIPLDVTISLTDLYHKYKDGAIVLVPFAYHYNSASTEIYQLFADVVEFLPVGAWAASTLERRQSSPLRAGLLGGAIIATLIESMQLIVLSRFTDTTDIVLGTVGAAAGGWLYGRSHLGEVPRASGDTTTTHEWLSTWSRSLAAVAAYSVFLFVGFSFPFDITHDRTLIAERLAGFFRVPFYALYQGTEFSAITQVLIRVLLFAMLGALWGRLALLARTRVARRMIAAIGMICSGALALSIELIQLAMPDKVADSTEVIICSAGALLGLVLARTLTRNRSEGASL